jgi:signal peptide peptidase SppA
MSLITRLCSEPWLISREYLPALLRSVEIQSRLNETRAAVIYPTPSAQTSEQPSDLQDMERYGATGVISINGPIMKNPDAYDLEMGACDIDQVRFLAEVATADPTVERVILRVNSPGGGYTGLPECAAVLAELAQAKPLYGFTDSVAASAAYWLISQAEEIYTTHSARLGSIGGYAIYQDVSEAYAKIGIRFNAISVGKFKLTGSPIKPMTDEERSMLQAGMDRVVADFKEAVNTRRTIAPEAMEGQTFDALEAIQKNLADTQVNSFEELIGLIATAH